jgi:putative aminopeptidase FrvX
MIDQDFLKALTEVPSVGTACNPVLTLLTERLSAAWSRRFVSDGYCLFQRRGGTPEDIKVLYVAHVDEVGGCVYGSHEGGAFLTRCWGNTPQVFADASLQAFDYLAESATNAYPVLGRVEKIQEEDRLVLEGDSIRPYRTVFTFKQETDYMGDSIVGKALDPRVTAYAVLEAALALHSPQVGLLFVMAEECAMDVARKAVAHLQTSCPNLSLIVNADVPELRNLGDSRLDMPAIRIFEGRNFIDPMFGIRVAEIMEQDGVEFHLSAARSGSQTLLFTPLAPTLSIALPSHGVHLPAYSMSLTGTERCIRLLYALGAAALEGRLPTSTTID